VSVAIHDVHEKVSVFLEAEFARIEHKMVTRVELIHTSDGFQPETLKEWTREANPEIFDNAKPEYRNAMVSDLIGLAEDRNSVFSQTENRFLVRAYQQAGGRMGYAFRVLNPIESDGGLGGVGNLPANGQGVLQQQMRNNEFIMRMNKDMMGGVVGTLTMQLAAAMKENAELRAERQALVAEINANKGAEAERELAVVKLSHEQERKNMLVGKAVQLLPVVAGRLAGNNGSTAGTALAAMVSELVSNLRPEQMAHIASGLTTEQRILFSEAAKLAQSTNAAVSSAASAAPSPNVTPVNGTPHP
jgi:hypothetical protein